MAKQQAKPTNTAPKRISKTEAINLIKSSNGTFVSVTFTKKDNSVCTLNGRTGVTAKGKGSKPAPNVGEMGYIRLYTNKEGNWRLANTQTMSALKVRKQEYIVGK